MITTVLLILASVPQTSFIKAQQTWRAEREAALTAPAGWLSVAGLFWVREGVQTIGSDPASDIVLPASAPAQVGTVTMANGKVSLQPRGGVVVTANGDALPETLKSDADGRPDKVQVGDLTISVIKRGKRIGLRMWDPNSRARKEFKGRHWFAPDGAFVIKARFVPHKKGKMIPILNVLGDTEPSPNPGYVEFRLKGKACRLEAIAEGDELFFNFQDATSGKETYAAGRFLNTEGPKNGFVTLDFNRAVNPPCAFTAFATCPLPPKGNVLKVRIAAGELKQH